MLNSCYKMVTTLHRLLGVQQSCSNITISRQIKLLPDSTFSVFACFYEKIAAILAAMLKTRFNTGIK